MIIAEDDPVQVDQQKFPAVKAAFGQLPQLAAFLFDKLPAHLRLDHSHGISHLGNHPLVVSVETFAIRISRTRLPNVPFVLMAS